MVYYFESRDGHLIYVGKNKYENEDLIKYGWNEDVWFHADDYSSPHVYLRLNEGETWDNIPQSALEDCCQLTKEGSIEGSKQERINIVYTPWSNLKKTATMDVGTIGYHDEKLRKLVIDVSRLKDILKAVSKTKREEQPNFQELQAQHVAELQRKKFEFAKQQKQQQVQMQQQAKVQAELKTYKDLFAQDNYKSNKEQTEDDDDFM